MVRRRMKQREAQYVGSSMRDMATANASLRLNWMKVQSGSREEISMWRLDASRPEGKNGTWSSCQQRSGTSDALGVRAPRTAGEELEGRIVDMEDESNVVH